jgi:hypothetical protein
MLLQLWVVGTITLVLSLASGALWWERQLPGQLRQAINHEEWSHCLAVTEHLAALRWLGEGAPQEQAHCRRQRAAQLWNDGDQAAALMVQQQLVQSNQAGARDVEQLQRWRKELRKLAMQRFRAGDLEGAIALLEPLDRAATNSGNRFSDNLRETWNRNRLEAERLDQLVAQERWWEALDSHNRLDHPWWQARTQPQRRTVEQVIASETARSTSSTVRPALMWSAEPSSTVLFNSSSRRGWSPGRHSRLAAVPWVGRLRRTVRRVSAAEGADRGVTKCPHNGVRVHAGGRQSDGGSLRCGLQPPPAPR